MQSVVPFFAVQDVVTAASTQSIVTSATVHGVTMSRSTRQIIIQPCTDRCQEFIRNHFVVPDDDGFVFIHREVDFFDVIFKTHEPINHPDAAVATIVSEHQVIVLTSIGDVLWRNALAKFDAVLIIGCCSNRSIVTNGVVTIADVELIDVLVVITDQLIVSKTTHQSVRHPVGGSTRIQDVISVTTVESVSAVTTVQYVVTLTTVEAVCIVPPHQDIVTTSTFQRVVTVTTE